MDSKISWFQPEQDGPSKDYWMKVWDTFQKNPSKNLHDRKPHEPGTSQQSQYQHMQYQHQHQVIEGNDPSNIWTNNWASTYSMNRNQENLIGGFGGCPWRPAKNLYDPMPIIASVFNIYICVYIMFEKVK